MSGSVIDLKGEMSLVNVLLLHSTEMATIGAALEAKKQAAGQFLEKSPVIVDCQALGDKAARLDFVVLREHVLATGFVPVGVRNVPEAAEADAVAAGWGLLRSGKLQQQAASPPKVEPIGVQRLMVIERPVRSGQQVYCPDGDIVVMQQTSAGSELLAGGSVHVYGALRGRVLAGIQGDVNARIFCQRLEAELIAIAGRYRLLDEIETELKKQAVMIYLEQEKLKIVPI